MKENMRTAHIVRLGKGLCSIEAGFVWSDLLTNLERTSDHCSNLAVCVLDAKEGNMDLHRSLRDKRTSDSEYLDRISEYEEKYMIA